MPWYHRHASPSPPTPPPSSPVGRRFPGHEGVHSAVLVRPTDDTLWVDDGFWDGTETTRGLHDRFRALVHGPVAGATHPPAIMGGHETADGGGAHGALVFVTAGSRPTLCLFTAESSPRSALSLSRVASEVASTVTLAVKDAVTRVGRGVVSWLPSPLALPAKAAGKALLAAGVRAWSGWGAGALQHDGALGPDAPPPAPQLPPAVPLECDFEFVDPDRCIDTVRAGLTCAAPLPPSHQSACRTLPRHVIGAAAAQPVWHVGAGDRLSGARVVGGLVGSGAPAPVEGVPGRLVRLVGPSTDGRNGGVGVRPAARRAGGVACAPAWHAGPRGSPQGHASVLPRRVGSRCWLVEAGCDSEPASGSDRSGASSAVPSPAVTPRDPAVESTGGATGLAAGASAPSRRMHEVVLAMER